MRSAWPAITAGKRPDQPPSLNSNCPPMHLNAARTMSASAPMMVLKSLGSRKL